MTENPTPHIQDGYSLDAQGNADYFADRTAGHITYDGLGWKLDGNPIPESEVAELAKHTVNVRLQEYQQQLGNMQPTNPLEAKIRRGTEGYLQRAANDEPINQMLRALKRNPKMRGKK
jgi:hypothetical protein